MSEKNNTIAYVDGSYNPDLGICGYGAVIFDESKEIILQNNFDDSESAGMRNISGEIAGALAVMEYCIEHGIKSVDIYYDYLGIEKWCTGEWRTNKPLTRAYKEKYDLLSLQLHVIFHKVKSHSGDKYNDWVDKLAKDSVGLS